MKAEDLRKLIKEGQKSFKDIDLEGCFINEVLTAFENIEKRMGKEAYMKEWREFPDYQLAELKEHLKNSR